MSQQELGQLLNDLSDSLETILRQADPDSQLVTDIAEEVNRVCGCLCMIAPSLKTIEALNKSISYIERFERILDDTANSNGGQLPYWLSSFSYMLEQRKALLEKTSAEWARQDQELDDLESSLFGY